MGAKPNKSLPKMEGYISQEAKIDIVVDSTPPPQPPVITSTPPTPTTVTAVDGVGKPCSDDEVEIQIRYSFIRKVRLPKGFTRADLEGVAAHQTVPAQLEFR